MTKQKTAIQPIRAQNYAQWYQQVIKLADLAELSSVRGCMVIKPWGYMLWESIQEQLNRRIKETGHENIYCPLFMPLSHLEKEAAHIKGFASECALVTHTRLVSEDGKLRLAGELAEPLVVRPTSETTIGELFSRWIQSHRDLPLLINQWANVVRWEMRPRLFLRTSEFLWQEGHTAHASTEEAQVETLKMLQVYKEFVERQLAIPVLVGEKTANERFPGAVNTYCIEAMMQDKKALQVATSHFLGQNFSKTFNIQFSNQDEQLSHVWTTSWGISTRLIGGLIMVHSDDDGFVLPPRIAAMHIIILPILHDEAKNKAVLAYCQQLKTILQAMHYDGRQLQVHIDQRDKRGGEKNWDWIKKGVPIRLEIGPREQEHQTVSLTRRDLPHHQRTSCPISTLTSDYITGQLEAMQQTLWHRAQSFMREHIQFIDHKDALYDYFKQKSIPGFAKIAWHKDNSQLEQSLKEELGITIRCLISTVQPEKCCFTQKETDVYAIFAKAY